MKPNIQKQSDRSSLATLGHENEADLDMPSGFAPRNLYAAHARAEIDGFVEMHWRAPQNAIN